MSSIVDKFLDRSKAQQSMMIGGVLLFAIYLFHTFAYKEPLEKKQKLTEEVEDLQDKIAKERNIARNLGKYKEEVRKLDTKLQLLLLELPDKREIHAFLDSVADLAVETGLEVLKFDQQSEVVREFFASVPVAVELQGTFHQLATFFDEVAHLERIVNIENISIKIESVKPTEVRINASCSATTFRYLSEKELAEKSGKNKAADSRKNR